MNQIRRERLLNYITEKGVITVKEANERFSEVSAMTIHRDLDELEKSGLIIRTRGGAMLADQHGHVESKLETRFLSQITEKRQMAQKAAKLIKAGSTVFLDAGTSCMALAQILPDIDLNIFTTGPNVAIELSKLTRPTIHICGGTLNRTNQALSGASTLEMLEKINIETAFIGVSGYTVSGGFTCGKEDEMQVKRLIMKRTVRRVILMDSSKYGKIYPYTFGELKDATCIVSDGELPQSFLKQADLEAVTIL